MKQEPMTDAILLGQFAEFIANRWTADYQHTYPISQYQAWDNWRARNGGMSVSWSCGSLAEAAQNWCWTTLDDVPSFFELATQLQYAISSGNEKQAEDLCYLIYRWGAVARNPTDRSRLWVQHAAARGQLTAAIRDAAALLSPGSAETLDRFNEHDLLMTSATTKVFAAAAPDGGVAIYDGRVGAALGLLARQFLEACPVNSVPNVLHFRWGPPQSPSQAAARTRDPSTTRHIFRQLPTGPASHQARAELSRRMNILFQAVTERLAERNIPVTFFDLERALFMTGYCVR